ncbi:MAG: hypothetical protein U1E65_17690 [Myxococcota bacterium]
MGTSINQLKSASAGASATPAPLTKAEIQKLRDEAETLRLALSKGSLGKAPNFAVVGGGGETISGGNQGLSVIASGLSFSAAKSEAAGAFNISAEFTPGGLLPSMYYVVSKSAAEAMKRFPANTPFNVDEFRVDRAPNKVPKYKPQKDVGLSSDNFVRSSTVTPSLGSVGASPEKRGGGSRGGSPSLGSWGGS